MPVVQSRRFAVKPVVTAVALAVAAVAHAAPTPNQLPGAGRITDVSPGATVNGLGVNNNIVNLANPAVITLGGAANAYAVINWGGNATAIAAEVTNPFGFNIGSAGKLTFTSTGGTANASVLNIDASGNPSQIFGQLESSTVGGGVAPSMFIANGNGIVVGAGGRIAAPNGVGLIGANMNNATARFDFVGNNSSGTSYVDVTTGQSTVTINGAINGSLTTNTPAVYVLLAGGDIVNTGNIFSNYTYALAGLRAAPTTDTVNGVAGTTVNRLASTTLSYTAGFGIGTDPGDLEVATAASTFVNTGSISGYEMHLFGANGVRSGTAGDTNVLVGLFSDYWIDVATAAPAAKTEIYNTVSGYTTNKSLGYFYVNRHDNTDGDVTISALTPGSQPSSISTTALVYIDGRNVAINSTINHKLASAGGVNAGENDLYIGADGTLTTTADIGASGHVILNAEGTMSVGSNVISDTDKTGYGGIYIDNQGKAAATTIAGNLTSYGDNISVEAAGPLTISGNIDAVNDSVYVYNYGTASGNTTTISGNISSSDYIGVYNYGPLSSNLNISGSLTTGYEANIYSGGNLQLGKVTADGYIYVGLDGLSSMLNGPVTSGYYFGYSATSATTKAKPAAVLSAPYIEMNVLNFVGVNAAGNTYANAGEKPAVQILTYSMDLMALGSFNAPIAGNTNWLLNQVQIGAIDGSSMPTALRAQANALDPLGDVYLSLSAVGAGFQAINIGITAGNATIDSGETFTPFNQVGLTTGTTQAGGLIGNGGSQLIINASGNLNIVAPETGGGSGSGNDVARTTVSRLWDVGGALAGMFNAPDRVGADVVVGPNGNYFEFPGGVVFKSGGVLTQYVPVYNAWTLEAVPYQGVFFEAPSIHSLSYTATNGNSWVNWSQAPAAGVPTIYQIRKPSPTTFGFVANPSAAHQNTYSLLITGTPVNTCPGFPPNCN